MPSQVETLSVLVAVEFVVMALIVLWLVPLEAAAPLLPLLVVFAGALYWYRA